MMCKEEGNYEESRRDCVVSDDEFCLEKPSSVF